MGTSKKMDFGHLVSHYTKYFTKKKGGEKEEDID
jgi:hypothetical protein